MPVKLLEAGFFLFLFLALYSYGIYPLLLFLLAKLVRNDWRSGGIDPKISIIISAYNEEGVIGEKIRNTLELEYPPEKLEIIISSDGSSDRTNQRAVEAGAPRILLRAFPERAGKTACLNRVVPEAQGEIVVFSDANSMFPRDLPARIVRNFADPQVGLVTGWTKYRNPAGGEAASGVYTRLERVTKIWESRISSCVGADGAVFALRKSLYQPLRNEDINDFVVPLNVIGQGKRVVMDSAVFCSEDTARQSAGEYRRQVRITTRTLGAILRNIRYLNPVRFGFFSFFLLSHKLMRFLVPFFLISCLFLNFLLIRQSWFYNTTFLAQILFIGAGLCSLLNPKPGRINGLLKFFFITSTAQFVSWIRIFSGKSDIMWVPER
jgi:cellulose synthase/poly-beta-1,6-N-acetylglucosamine synthase-like glycosyltransferase